MTSALNFLIKELEKDLLEVYIERHAKSKIKSLKRLIKLEVYKSVGPLQDQLDRLKECSNCEVAPCDKCKTCKFNSTSSKSTKEFDYWREHRGEGE